MGPVSSAVTLAVLAAIVVYASEDNVTITPLGTPETVVPLSNRTTNSTESPKPLRPIYDGDAERKRQRAAFNSKADGFASLNYHDALERYADFIDEDGRHRRGGQGMGDFYEDQHGGIKLPDTPIVKKGNLDPDVEDATCDPRDNRFTPERDRSCQAYMADPKNWKSIKPMSSILTAGRTIKFKLYFKNGAYAALKLAQEKFVQEPASELLSYTADRVLGFNRVPVTVWATMPVKYLKAAAATKGEGYSRWFQRAVIKTKRVALSLHDDMSVDPPEQSVYVTLQLWMIDVHPADETEMRPPEHLSELLNVEKEFPAFDANQTYPLNNTVAELSDMHLFDFVVGNSDRWAKHNQFVYGACPDCKTPPQRRLIGQPSYAYIDHGLTFFFKHLPTRSIYAGMMRSRRGAALCRFRGSTVARLLEAGTSNITFYDRLRGNVPDSIFTILSPPGVNTARERFPKLLEFFQKCEENHGQEAVRFFSGGLPALPSVYANVPHRTEEMDDKDAGLAEKAAAMDDEDANRNDRRGGGRMRRMRGDDDDDEGGRRRRGRRGRRGRMAGDGGMIGEPGGRTRRSRNHQSAFDSRADGFANTTFEAALDSYVALVNASRRLKVDQGGLNFTPIVEDHHAGIKLPDPPLLSRPFGAPVADDPRCNPQENRFTPEDDRRCQAYMADPKNWLSIKPMSSILSAGRTLKFKLYFKKGGHAVLKITHALFTHETVSELLAYTTDRVLGFNRVPPLVWTTVPLKYLQAAASTKGSYYCGWFDKDVMRTDDALKYMFDHPLTNERLVHVTLQLWMTDVHPAEDTMLAPPRSLYRALDAEERFPKPVDVTPEVFNNTLGEFSDMGLFDYVIGNTDRWFRHNIFVYGGCPECNVTESKRIRGPPMYAFIDHGLSFVSSPRRNLYAGGGRRGAPSLAACRFRANTVERLRSAVPMVERKRKDWRAGEALLLEGGGGGAEEEPSTFLRRLSRHLPTPATEFLSAKALRAANSRLVEMVVMMDKCEKEFGAAQVLAFAGGSLRELPVGYGESIIQPNFTFPPLTINNITVLDSGNHTAPPVEPAFVKNRQNTPRRASAGGRVSDLLKSERKKFNSRAEGFSNLTYDAALALFRNRTRHSHRGVAARQTGGAGFKPFYEAHSGGIRLPEVPLTQRRPDAPIAEDADCDPRDNRFTPQLDAKCRAYMADPKNWRSIKPMSSILIAGRTIKFKLYFKNGAHAVLKVTQNGFIHETVAELMAFETDRVLGFNRVPPLVWTEVPVDYLRAATAAQEESAYSVWFQEAIVTDPIARRLIHDVPSIVNTTTPGSNTTVQSVYVTLQLFMNDVHNADESLLRLPHGIADALDAEQPLSKAFEESGSLARLAVAEFSDLSLFDFAIGNTDRWPNHNIFVYGACPECNVTEDQAIRGAPMYAFIDHGLSFFGGPSARNIYNVERHQTHACRFRASTVERLTRLADGDGEGATKPVSARILDRLPPSAIEFLARRRHSRRRTKRPDGIETPPPTTTAAAEGADADAQAALDTAAAEQQPEATEEAPIATTAPPTTALSLRTPLRRVDRRLSELVSMFRTCEERFGIDPVRYFKP